MKFSDLPIPSSQLRRAQLRSFVRLCSLALLVLCPLISRATILTGPITNSANQHYYYLLDTSSWTDAENEAITLGGTLVTINDLAEHDWVYTNFSMFGDIPRHLWIGLYRTNVPGGFRWITDEPYSFSHWATGEPNNCDMIEDRGMIFAPDIPVGGFWNDVSDSGFGGCGGGQMFIYGVVEVDATPPFVITHPANQVAYAGSQVTFTVLAGGAQPLSYQWFFNGTNIADATSSALILTNVDSSNVGSYSVQITNLYGFTNSNPALLTLVPPPPCVPLPQGLVSWWKAENNALDQIGSNSGTLQNGATFAAAQLGQSFSFDGVNGYVRIPRSTSLIPSNQLTIEFWMRASANNSMTSLQGLVTSDFYGISISPGVQSRFGVDFFISTNNGGFFSQVSTANGGGAVVTSNAWHHIAGIYDGSKIQLYIDGIAWGNSVSVSGAISPMPSNGFLSIGSESGRTTCPFCNRFFNGAIDEVGIYTRALSAGEIAAIYNAGAAGKCTAATGPYFFLQPTNRTTFVRSNVVFAAIVGGTPPLAYQWQRYGTNLPSATNSTYTITNVQPSKAGPYSVQVTNSLGNLTSSNASLQVVALLAFGNGQPLTNNPNNFNASPTIQLQTFFTNGSIFYTLDGSPPSFASTAYAGPFVVTSNVTLRVLGYSADFSEFSELGPIFVLLPPIYTLSATTAGGGSVTFNPPGGSYFSNATVSVTAAPSAGWTFLHWLGDLAGSNNPASITMSRNKQVQPVFGTTLSTSVAGNGSISKIPDSSLYPYGSVVRLVAIPQTGNYFGVWGNAASGNVNPLSFTVTNANQTVSALFAPLGGGQAALTVIPDGFGHVTESPQANVYSTGAGVTLTAVPDPGQSFIGWSGDASGSSNPLNITMTTSKVITASFSTLPRLSANPPVEGLLKDGFRFSLFGEFNRNYQIDVTTNIPNWAPLTVLTNYYNQVQYLDPAGTNKATRLYRAMRLP